MRYIAMMVAPVFFSVVMFLVHPGHSDIILTGLVLVAVVMAVLNKLIP